MKNRKLLLLIVSAILVGIVIYNFWPSNGTNSAVNEELTIGYPHLRIAMPVIVAYHNGYFEDQGLDVALKPYVTAQPMMDAIVSGKINLGGFCALPITFGAIARSNQELLFMGGMFENNSHSISELIVKDTSNIRSIRDLEGKRIGILPTRAYEVWIQDILTNNGIDLTNVTISYVKPNLQANSLNSGDVDALFTNDPAATITKSNQIGSTMGNGLVPNTTNINPFYFGSFNVRKDFANQNPEVVEKVATALDMAIQFISQNQLEAKKIMGAIDPKKGKPYLPEAYLPIVEDFPDSFFKGINYTSESELNELKNYYLKKNILPKNISLEGAQYRY